MSKLQVGIPVDLTTLSKLEAKVGAISKSMLDYEAFSDEHLGLWYPLDGRSCIGTLYHSLTGKTEVPNALEDGAFFRQAKDGRELGSFEGDAIRNITASWSYPPAMTYHTGGAVYKGARNSSGDVGQGSLNGAAVHFDASRVVPTADENRPKNIAVNYYIKVGY